MRTLIIGFFGLALIACDDEAGEPVADTNTNQPRSADMWVPPDSAIIPVDSAVMVDSGGSDAQVEADSSQADAAPQGCQNDDECPGDEICYDTRCLPNSRCDVDTPCLAGTRCVAGICVGDPSANGILEANPEVLSYTFSEVGQVVERGLGIINGGDTVITITAVTSDNPVFVVSALMLPTRLTPDAFLSLTVTYTADDTTADMGTLQITTAEGATLDVLLRSSRKVVQQGAPCLEVAPLRLNFGGVSRGQVDTQTFRLTTCTNTPVTVLGIRRGLGLFGPLPDTFQLDNPPAFPLAIQPGDSVDITVAYAPRRAGIEGGHFEVISDDANEPNKRVEVFAIAEPPALMDVALHVRLNWNTDLTDVDLHLLGPGGAMWTCEGDCYFSNGQPNWGDPDEFRDDPFLDVDNTDGFGPENINLEAPLPGTYRVIVQYWADHGGDIPSATVEVLSFGQVVGQYGPIRLSRTGDEWEVVDIEWPAMMLTPLGGVVNRNVGPLCGGF